MDQVGYLVIVRIDHAHPLLTDYPLLPNDLLVKDEDGTWTKESPGSLVGGFTLTAAQESTLMEVSFMRMGLTYAIKKG